MKKVAAEPRREIDFGQATRGPVIPARPGKVKLSIRLDTAVVDWFRDQADLAGGGNYQTLINDALVAWIQQRSMLDAVRQVVREEIVAAGSLRDQDAPTRLASSKSSGATDPIAGR